MSKNRELWIDNLKIFACVLVVLGHLFQSMVAAEIINDSFIYQWFNKTIYYFHVPLFFICSGYLYQKYTDTSSFLGWLKNVHSKATALLIPYVTFSVVTWLLKNIFSDSVNQETDGLVVSLVWNPISPYWYLLALFFIFLLIPVMNSKQGTITVLLAALTTKVILLIPTGLDVYIINIVFGNIIWFVIGMGLYKFDIIPLLKKKICLLLAILIAILFLLFSLWLACIDNYIPVISFAMGLAACFVFVVLAIQTENFRISTRIALLFARYTFPVFLLHTIFAAAFRSLLSKIGITNASLHIFSGMIISFAGPVLAYMLASRIKALDFFFYPNKYLVTKKKN